MGVSSHALQPRGDKMALQVPYRAIISMLGRLPSKFFRAVKRFFKRANAILIL